MLLLMTMGENLFKWVMSQSSSMIASTFERTFSLRFLEDSGGVRKKWVLRAWTKIELARDCWPYTSLHMSVVYSIALSGIKVLLVWNLDSVTIRGLKPLPSHCRCRWPGPQLFASGPNRYIEDKYENIIQTSLGIQYVCIHIFHSVFLWLVQIVQTIYKIIIQVSFCKFAPVSVTFLSPWQSPPSREPFPVGRLQSLPGFEEQ